MRRILYQLTDEIAGYEEVMRDNLRMLVKLDVIFARGKLSSDLGAVEPEINTEGRMELTGARHPMIPDVYKRQVCGGARPASGIILHI